MVVSSQSEGHQTKDKRQKRIRDPSVTEKKEKQARAHQKDRFCPFQQNKSARLKQLVINKPPQPMQARPGTLGPSDSGKTIPRGTDLFSLIHLPVLKCHPASSTIRTGL